MTRGKTLVLYPLRMISRAWNSRRAAAAVEFAILMPILTAIIIGLINWGLVMLEKMSLTSAARAGAQYALFDNSDTDSIKQAVVDSTNLSITTSNVTTSCTCGDGSSTTCGVTCPGTGSDADQFMTINVSESYTLLLVSTTLTLTGSATIRTE